MALFAKEANSCIDGLELDPEEEDSANWTFIIVDLT
jgi:hypothetical protein